MLPLLLTCLFLLQPYEIVVVGKRPRGESVKADQSGNTVELKGKNILTRGSTLGEAVTHSPGISHRSTGGAGHLSQVMIRGSSPSQVVWFLDGFRLGEGTGGSMDAAQLPLAGVATVGIYKSGVPLEFGAEGIGGGINIVPMAPRGNTFAFHHTMGSYGTLMDSFVLGLRTWGIAHLLSGSLVTTNGDYPYFFDNGTEYTREDDGFARRENNSVRRIRLLYGAFATLGDIHFRAYALGSKSRNGVPGPGSIVTRSAFYEYQRGSLMLKATKSALVWRASGGAWVEGLWDHYADTLGELGIGVSDDTSRIFTRGAMASFQYGLQRHRLTLTALGRFETLRSDRFMAPQTQDENREQLHFGTRYRFVAKQLFVQTSAMALCLSGMDCYQALRGGIRYAPWRGLKLRTNISSAVRVPTFMEMYGNTGALKGNPALKPEKSISADLGYTAKGKMGSFRGSLSQTLFFRSADNLIQYIPNSQFIARAENIAEARIMGAENAVTLIHPRGRMKVAYTYMTTENISELSYQNGQELPGRSRHAIVTDLSTRFSYGGWGFTPSWEFTGLIGGNFDASGRRPMPPRLFHSLALFITTPYKGVSFHLAYRNIGSPLYEMVERRPQPATGPAEYPQAVSNYLGYPIPGSTWFFTISSSL